MSLLEAHITCRHPRESKAAHTPSKGWSKRSRNHNGKSEEGKYWGEPMRAQSVDMGAGICVGKRNAQPNNKDDNVINCNSQSKRGKHWEEPVRKRKTRVRKARLRPVSCIASVILANECAIFDLHGSGRLGRDRNLYQAGERRNSKSDMAGWMNNRELHHINSP